QPVPAADAPRPPEDAPRAESWNLLLAQVTAGTPQPPTAPQEPRPLELPPPPPPTKSQDADMPPSREVPPPPPPAATPSVDRPAGDAMTALRRLFKQADDECAALDSYICRMTRREQVNGASKPEEMMLFKFRKQPFSIYFKWIGNEGKGREVVYVKG